MLPTSAPNPPNTNSPSGFPSDESHVEGNKRSSDRTSSSIAFRQHEATENPVPVPDMPVSVTTTHTAPVLAIRSATGPQAAQDINTEPLMIADGVFIGEGRAKSGEKFFLKMEKITEANRSQWNSYREFTLGLTRPSRSLLAYIAGTTKKIRADDGTIRFVNDHYDEMFEALGQTKEEFDDLIKLFGDRGYTCAPEDKARCATLLDTFTGAGYFSVGLRHGLHVVYATKKADFQMPITVGNESSVKLLTLKEYIRLYSDLLMCTSADFSWKKGFYSRGTFRNPCNAIENTHKGVAMILRSFSGAVAKKFFSEMQTLYVKPLTSMQYQISSTLQPEDYSVEKYSHEEALEISRKALLNGDNFEMPMNLIKVSALDRFYRAHAST
jgi:hypothetical protein